MRFSGREEIAGGRKRQMKDGKQTRKYLGYYC